MEQRYEALLDCPHPVSLKHPPMSAGNRAAQFAPFAALTGFDGQIAEVQRVRCDRVLLGEDDIEAITAVLSTVKLHDRLTVTYFYESPGTDGFGGFAEGEYRTLTGEVTQFHPEEERMRVAFGEDWVDISFADVAKLTRVE